MKKENEKIFVCRVCGTGYNTLEEANACESKCLKNAAIKLAEKEKVEKVKVLKKELEVLYAEEEKIEQNIEAYDEEIEEIEIKRREEEDKLNEIDNKIWEKKVELSKVSVKEKEENYKVNGEDVTKEEFFNGLEKMFQSFFPFS